MFCSQCGSAMTKTGGNIMFCENCGNKLPEGAKFCGGCGATPPAQIASSYQQDYAPPQSTAYSGQSGTEPLRVGQYIGILLLMCVPLLGVILLFVWSFGGSVNLNKKNYARAMLIVCAIGLILSIIFVAALTSIIGELLGGMGDYY